ncbi:MAG: Fic family protein [Anaerobutyricum hallii]
MSCRRRIYTFIEFMLSQIDKILDELSNQMDEDDGQLTESIKKLLNVMEYRCVIYEQNAYGKTRITFKEGFRRNYLRPAMKMNLIRMTIPDKPNSRNQRYGEGLIKILICRRQNRRFQREPMECIPSSRQLKKYKIFVLPGWISGNIFMPPIVAFHEIPLVLRLQVLSVAGRLYSNLYIL